MKPKIRIENLVKIYGKASKSTQKALDLLKEGVSKDEIQKKTGQVVGVANASFSVQEGEIFVVMGLSGSGKSTLIRCVNRLIEPTSGHIYIDDEDIVAVDERRLREIRRTRMAMVFQHFALFPHKTVVENVAYGLKVRGLPEQEQREKALEALDLVGLKSWADYRPDNLSGGMQQRVGLARALATEADILLMDEAFSALDPLIRREMQDELIQLQDRLHKTVLFITHDLNEALRVGNTIAVLQQDGRIVQIGTPEEIITQPADEYVAEFTQDVDQARVLTAESVMKAAEGLVFKPDAPVKTALNRLKLAHVDALYMVNEQHNPRGLVLKPDLLKAANNGAVDLSDVVRAEFPQTVKETPLTDLYSLCAAGLPVAVVDEQNRLQGIIDPLDIFATLSSRGEGAATE